MAKDLTGKFQLMWIIMQVAVAQVAVPGVYWAAEKAVVLFCKWYSLSQQALRKGALWPLGDLG